MKIAIIGGGPAGMMCAIKAAENHEVFLYEKNEKLGKKLFITGKGRCNLTNYCDEREFLKNIVRNKNFMYSSIYSLSPFTTYYYFEELGLPLKIERGNRVFPASDKSSDVIKIYEKKLREMGVKIKLNSEIKSIKKDEDCFVLNDREKYDKVVIATGGVSYKLTGSTGDGYKFAKNFNHKVVETVPGLIGINLYNGFSLAGLTLKNVELKVVKDKKIISREFGELLFTHRGISGPIVLTTSSKINRLRDFEIYLDLKPALTNEKLDNRILRDFCENQNKIIENVMRLLLPRDLISYILESAEIESDKKVNQITKEERDKLVKTIKNFELKFESLDDINRAIITSGGVDVVDIDPKTMESKIVKGLYFIGEVLDVDAVTGGFNIQIANSTGYNCGINL
ncbi:MAG: NAD(P)/FAD-dependent oxidoreductase [Peptoniphilus sp.]|uniref:NAD(P)/FAD-dependent oxidoreductase n=1 Tax=Peptoniphilus sp. TaxID=1971214 RepID=UPI0025DFD999|nr:NAD(P)/FAD-dependent oxidoreductase [Peptoniphilus sp.]MCI5644006.1 NAD(P)/FAD-dependent oxidoreductase [Peptoniphilus sp.]MDD7352817.1 NAD(P)/FAD-dependent oxidoreductase [Peptoniphilaceae bacterium]